MSSFKCVKIDASNNNISKADKLLLDEFTLLHQSWMEVGEHKIFLPTRYQEIMDEIENFEVRDDDVWIVSYPRSGTTWLQEMSWLIANNCNFTAAKRMISNRFTYIEGSCFIDEANYKKIAQIDSHMDIEHAKKIKSPRYFKTHLPWHLLPKQIRNNEAKPKIIYAVRDAKDVCISLYYMYKNLQNYTANLDHFVELFLNGRTHYGPYWTHVYSYWNQKNKPNLLLLRYEDMKTKLPTVIRTVANFLNKDITENQINALSLHVSFDTMKNNVFANNEVFVQFIRMLYPQKLPEGMTFQKFMRKGQIGSYKDDMDAETIKRFEKWIYEHTKGEKFESELKISNGV